MFMLALTKKSFPRKYCGKSKSANKKQLSSRQISQIFSAIVKIVARYQLPAQIFSAKEKRTPYM